MRCTEFPIALKKETNKLAEIKDVPNGKGCNCYCFYCKGDLIAANREGIQITAHFKHTPGSNCTLSYETYLHWVTKEIFKDFTNFEFPPITFIDLYVKYWCLETSKIEKIKKLFSRYNLPDEFRDINEYKFTVKVPSKHPIRECTTEKRLKNETDAIQPDILLRLDSMNLLIEPYVTNRVSEKKLLKIRELDISAITIDLFSFRKQYKENFTITCLKEHLQRNSSKEWIYVSEGFRETLFNFSLEFLENRFKERIYLVQDYANYESKINSNEMEISNSRNIIEDLKNKIDRIDKENIELTNKKKLYITSMYSE